MPILNSIKIAEEQAQNLRRDAEAKVRVLLEENRILAEMTVQSMNEAGEKARLDAEKRTLSDIERLRLDVNIKTATESQAIRRKAQSRTGKAARFLLGKVSKS